MSYSPLWELSYTRIKLFFREPSAVFWTFGFPVILSVALALAFRNRPPDPIPVAIEAGPGAEHTAEVLRQREDMRATILSSEQAHNALRSGRVSLVVTPGAPRTYTFDPTRPESRIARVIVDDVLQLADGRHDPTAVSDRSLTEPGARYIDFLIPGLIGVNLMQSGLWGVAFVIVEMRTQRLLKRFLATPMKRAHFLASFVFMRLFFLFMEVPFFLIFARLAFGVVVRGSIPLVFGVSLLGAVAFAGLGLMVGSRAQNTQTAGGLMNVVMMPMFLLSGVFFSSAKFPQLLQPFIRLLPLTALNDALRGIINEGVGISGILYPILNLSVVSIVTFAVALRIFRWQ